MTRFSLHYFRLCVYNSVSSINSYATMKPGYCTQYSERLQVKRPRNRCSIPDRGCSLIGSIKTDTEAQPASYQLGTRGPFPGVKRPWRESNRSPSPSAEVRDAQSYLHSSISFRGPVLNSLSTTISPVVKRQGREADHWTPTSAEVKKTWVCTSTPRFVFRA
jgi:hypothetical protein